MICYILYIPDPVGPRQWMEDVLVRISEYERSVCSYQASSEPLDSSQPKSGVKDPTWNYLEQKRATWNQVVPGWQNRPQVAYLVKKYINKVVLNRRLTFTNEERLILYFKF